MRRGFHGVVVLAVAALLLGVGGASGPSASAGALASSATGVAPASAPLSAFSNGMPASLVLGAPNFTTVWPDPNDSAFRGAAELAAMDGHGNIWVADFTGSRVLEFSPPFSDGKKASAVIGQSSFTGFASGTSSTNLSEPTAATLDAGGDLWISDWLNNRVLEFRAPLTTGMAASVVLGQSTVTGNAPGAGPANLSGPIGASFDASGDLWVADGGNNRVLEFRPPFATGMAASLVVGQSSFYGTRDGVTALNESNPSDVAVADNTLWVADSGNNRTLGYSAPFVTGEAATLVLGQSSFTRSNSSGAAAFVDPGSVSVDAGGNLWVSDTYDNRVLEFEPPFSNFETPQVAIGQTSLSGVAPGTTRTTLNTPDGAFVDPNGSLWVTDGQNNRVLEYLPARYTVTINATGLADGARWTALVDGRDLTGTGTLSTSVTNGTHSLTIPPLPGLRPEPATEPFAVSAAPVSLSVRFTPTGTNPFSVGMPASVVLGQPNFDSAFLYTVPNASSLGPNTSAVAIGANGTLWIADGAANRVLEFRPPFTTYEGASLVLGQSDFTGSAAGAGASNLSAPDGLAFDSVGDLWVSDTGNNRVVEFTPPFRTGMGASTVLGQPGFGTDGAGHLAYQLNGPAGLAFHAGSLWVSDHSNNRVVGYSPPFATGASASLALGQSALTGSAGGRTATNLSLPDGVAFDSHGDAWVADGGNDRVVEYPAPLGTGEAATIVLGQPDLTSNVSAFSTGLVAPHGVWVDGQENVWVADSGDNRVYEYSAESGPIATNQTPSVVLGQGSLTGTGANTSRSGLSDPAAITTNGSGDLWVVDARNLRALEYVPTRYALNFTAVGLPSGSDWSLELNGTLLPVSGSLASTPSVNGTFNWTAIAPLGWAASPGAGSVTVNGAATNVSISFGPFAYPVTFTETGLPAGTTWSATIGSTTNSSSGTFLILNEANGSYAYSIGPVSGYTPTPSSGRVTVAGAPGSVAVSFSPGGPAPTVGPQGLALIALVVAILAVGGAIIAVAGLTLLRRVKGRPPPTPGDSLPGDVPAPPMSGSPPGASEEPIRPSR
ncbi:MAG: NHL repeat-containing protein [Thermoplasmata archaeon]